MSWSCPPVRFFTSTRPGHLAAHHADQLLGGNLVGIAGPGVLAVAQQQDAVGNQLDLIQLVGNVNHGHALVAELLYHLVQLARLVRGQG